MVRSHAALPFSFHTCDMKVPEARPSPYMSSYSDAEAGWQLELIMAKVLVTPPHLCPRPAKSASRTVCKKKKKKKTRMFNVSTVTSVACHAKAFR